MNNYELNRRGNSQPHVYRRQTRAEKMRKKRMKRRVFLVSTVCILLSVAVTFGVGFGVFGWGNNGGVSIASSSEALASADTTPPSGTSGTAAASLPASVPEPQPTEHTLSFSAVGDNLIHEAVYVSAQQHAGGEGYDFSYCYENVTDFFGQYDVNWINQETLVNDEFPASTYPMFSTPGEMGHALYDAGWRVFALSNNHTYDKENMGDVSGVSATMRFWESMPEDVVTTGLFTGYDDDSGISIHEQNGIKIAYVAFAESTNGIPPPSDLEAFVIYTTNLYGDADVAAMEHKVRRARELADVVVVSVHWGVEYSHTPTDGQRNLAANFAEWGADVVIGTHPHVIQPIEYVETSDGRQVPVAYSLGNFLSAQNEPPRMVGLAFTFDISMTVEPDGTHLPATITNVKAYPAITHYEYSGGSFYENSRVYMYNDYTDELADQHAVPGGISREYIANLASDVISDEFLVLT